MQEAVGAQPKKARIVYIGGEEEARAALTVRFADAGYHLVSHEDASRADIGLIDLRGRKVSSRKAQSIAGLLRKSSPECSILIIADPYIDETARKALRRHGEVVIMLTSADAVIERCRQILRLRNIAEESGERLKTLAGLNRLNEFPPISSPVTPLRVLIAGEPGASALTTLNALRPIAEQCVCVFSAGQALRAVESMKFDAAFFLPKRENDPLMSLARALRRHPSHHAMPVIFPLSDPDDAAEFTRRGASDYILTGHIHHDLGPRTQLIARRARLLKAMRRFLQACEGDGVRDSLSGAFTATYLSEHGARLCARADQTGRSLSVVALSIETEAQITGQPEPGRRALHQAARLINRVTRAEDTVARVANDTFFIMLPATCERDANNAALRIQGVLENTVFRGGNDDLLYGVQVNAAACKRPENFTIEETVALSLAVLRDAKAEKTTQHQQFPQ